MVKRKRVTEKDLHITEAMIAESYGRLKQSVVRAPSRGLRSVGQRITEHPFEAAAIATVVGITAYALFRLTRPHVASDKVNEHTYTSMKKDSLPLAIPSTIDNEIAEISERIMVELETASSQDLSEAKYAKKILQLSDLHYTKNILHEIESVPTGAERVIEKRAVIKALLLSTWLQRLYFIIRSALMSLLAVVVTFFYVSFFGQIGVVLAVFMGVVIFIVGLIVTRLFDIQTVKVTKYIVLRLASHTTIREFIMKHL